MSVKWFIERKAVLGFVLAFALLAVAGVVSYRRLRQFEETSRWLAHTHDVRANVESGLIALLNVQTGTRGFVLTGEPRYLEPYEQALPKIPRQLARLRQLTADNPHHQKRLDHLDVLVPEFLAYMKLRLETRQQKGFAAAVEQVATGKGKKLMDEIRAVFAEMEEEEGQLLKARTEAVGASARQAILVSSLSSLLAVLLFGSCFHLIRRQIHRTQQAEVKARDARVFAESIVDAVREPLLVLAGDLRVITANRSFYRHFRLSAATTENRYLFDLADGKWNIPELNARLGQVIPGDGSFDDFEVTSEFSGLGQRVLMLNARKLYREGNNTHRILLAIEDVTERREAEILSQRAAEQQRRALRLLDATQDGVFMFDPQTLRFFYVNQGAMDQTGYSREELLTMTPLDIKPEFDPPRFRHMLAPLLDGTASSHTFTTVHRRKDGRDVPVEIILQCVDLDSGNRNMVAMVRDITERKRVESTVAALLEAAPEAMVVTDGKGLIVRINALTEKLFGYSREELLGRRVEVLIPARFRERHVAHWERYSARPYMRPMAGLSALCALRKDGSEFPAEISLGPVETPSGILIMAAIRDITARQRVEEERDRFFNLSRDMICIAGFDGYFKRLNPAWEKTLGFTLEEFLAVPYLEFVHPDDRAATSAEAAKLATGLETISFENRYRCKDGSYKWILWSSTPSLNHQLIFAVARDVTARKCTEEALQRAKEEAERASQLKDQFLSMMSHELRTPLNSILGFSELLDDARNGPLNDRQQRYLSHVRNGGHHLLRLINDLLDLTRIEAGRLELAMEAIVVEPVIAGVLESLRPLADKKSLSISSRCEPGLAVRADATRFKQILLNLLGNAVKFTPEGGQVEIAGEAEDGQARIAVRDTGPGIPTEEQTRIFDSFYRLPGSAGAEGTGLGLTIAHRLVLLQGGQMGLDSQPGHGACFYFSLPAALSPPVRARAHAAVRPLTEPAPLVLIVEDDPVSGKLLQSQLASAGFDTEWCDTGERALHLAAELQPAAITLDILMAPTSGWEVLTRLRSNPRTATIPVVVSTVVDQPAMGFALGADDYLVKPVEKSSLLGAIDRCVRARGELRFSRPVLVVEDDAPTREMITELLTAQGYAVAAVADGTEARHWMASSLPDLVILDLVLPGVNGFELLAEWRADSRTVHVPVFVVTGKELAAEEERFLHKNAEVLLSKRLAWQTPLLDQLRRVLGPAAAKTLFADQKGNP